MGIIAQALGTMSSIQPDQIRYIKLGDGGRWAQESFSDGTLCFGYSTIPHEVCERKDWQEVGRLLSDRKSKGAQTAGVNEIRAFYELGKDCLWITFADGHLWWAFAGPKVQWIGDGAADSPLENEQHSTVGAKLTFSASRLRWAQSAPN
jgi:hypothetical protein